MNQTTQPGPCRCTIGTTYSPRGVLEEGIRFCALHAKAEEMRDALKGMLNGADELMGEVVTRRAARWGIINDAMVVTHALLAELEDRGA